ncbi:MAG: hypothetical protein C6D10_04210 [Candidatus Liberibacter solanacearum]
MAAASNALIRWLVGGGGKGATSVVEPQEANVKLMSDNKIILYFEIFITMFLSGHLTMAVGG